MHSEAVEQRIGRIDRIGQVYPVVQIRNYFYEDTIEARVYKALTNRIDWFETVVGQLQPILVQVGRVIEELVMTEPKTREAALKLRLGELEESIAAHASADVLDVYQGTETVQPAAPARTPVTVQELGEALLGSRLLGGAFRSVDDLAGAHVLDLQDGRFEPTLVTFDAAVFDEKPSTVRFLSYGDSLLDELLERAGGPADDPARGILRLSIEEPVPLVAYFTRDPQGHAVLLGDLVALRQALEGDGPATEWDDAAQEKAKAVFQREIDSVTKRLSDAAQARSRGARAMLEEQAKECLYRAALLEIVQSARRDGVPPDDPSLYSDYAYRGLAGRGAPYAQLLQTVHLERSPNPADPYVQKLAAMTPDQLRGLAVSLQQEGVRLLNRFQRLSRSEVGVRAGEITRQVLGV